MHVETNRWHALGPATHKAHIAPFRRVLVYAEEKGGEKTVAVSLDDLQHRAPVVRGHKSNSAMRRTDRMTSYTRVCRMH